MLTAVLVVLVMLCLVLVFYALFLNNTGGFLNNTGGSAASPVVDSTVVESTEPTLPDRTEEFLDAFENSFVGPYTTSGVLEFSNDQALTRQVVRRARLDDRSLDQIGGGALVTRGGNLRRCSDDGTQFLCTDPEPEPTLADRRAEMAGLIAEGYLVTQESQSCYVLTAEGDGSFSRLGQLTTYCFDPETGAVSSRVTQKGQRTESFIAAEIRATVTEQDLAPE